MPDRDFFSFCTSLKPIELKAIGQLSSVKHIDEGEVVYRPGESSDALYIINRGVVAISRSESENDRVEGYLSRGDIFGDLEVLSGQPRTHFIRTCEPSGLQCFPSKDFAELISRVPGFFHYLCQRLAHRLLEANEAAWTRSHCMEMSGNLANFDLITIYQTIINSAQTGELRILDDKKECLATFSFINGRPCRGQFEHLTGEEAFWQLFQADTLSGSFAFSSGNQAATATIASETIENYCNEMLLTAVQRRDELDALKEQVPAKVTTVRRQKLNFDWPAEASADLRPIAEHIWQIAYSAPIELDNLYRKCSVCEFKIYQVVDALIRSEHFQWVIPDGAEITATVAV